MLPKSRKQSDVWYFTLDIMNLCMVGETTAREMIKKWNKELEESGYTAVKGQVPQAYVKKKLALIF